MEMTLDRDPVLHDGDPLPPLWHWLYFLRSAKLGELGRDGHPALGGFLPPVALPRRMWAGGRFGFTTPLPIGVEATKTSTIRDVELKQGRSGALCFVTVRHEIHVGTTHILWEEHDIVYREEPLSSAAPNSRRVAGSDWEVSECTVATEVMLFRYSALTFNGHRIHYDRDYARNVEAHKGLVVHGPLIATLLADLAVRCNPGHPLVGFEFRAESPLYDNHPFYLKAGRPGGTLPMAAVTSDGFIAVKATAHF
jgi:3-methylfumaryl-CoA hydratase